MNHEIIRDHATSRPRGFGFIVFDSEKAVDDLFAKRGNMIDLNGAQVSLANKKIRRVVSQIAKITSYINNKA
jgi:heterogeneous nuclear ribonucleoprotein A1/A3